MPQEKRQKLSTAPALFGNRYGTLPTKPVTSALKIRPPPAAATTPSSSTTTTSATTATPSTPTTPSLVITSSLPPAIRKYLLQALSQGWTESLTRSSPTSSSSSSSTAISTKAILLSLQAMIHQDVWSIRQSALEYMGNIVARTVLSKDQIGIIVGCIEKGILEPKFVQVKQAALLVLEKLLINTVHKGIVKEDYLLRIRKIITTVSTDTQTSMLETASKLQTLMLQY